MLADLPDGRPNPNTHAYGHRDLAAEEHLVADLPEPGAELVIRHNEERFDRKHAMVTKRLKIVDARDMVTLLPDDDFEGELHGDQLLAAEREADARPGAAIRMSEVIERIIARDNLERPVSPPPRMPPPPSLQRAGPSGLNAHLPAFRRQVDSSDEDEPDRPVWPPRRPHLEFEKGDYEQEYAETEPLTHSKKVRRANPFIDAEAGVDGEASGDVGSDNDNDDLDGFIIADDIEF